MNSQDRPYFLWDYDLTDNQVRRIIRGTNDVERQWMMGRILTSARFDDVWRYVTVDDVVREFPNLRLRPGVRKAWKRALTTWGHHV